MTRRLSVSIAGLALMLCMSFAGAEGLRLDEGHWRLELSGMHALNTSGLDRSGDYAVIGAVEYEVPAGKRAALGLRLLPLFVYDQGRGRCEGSRRHSGNTLLGGGLGVTGRLYQHAEERRGFFLEGNASVLFHDNLMTGNGSNVNFMTGLGVGYQCKDGWHLSLLFEHVSNAGLDRDNDGAEILGLGFGYRF